MSQKRVTFCDTRNMEQNNEKNMTKYDRKRLAKAEAAKREKKKQTITIFATIAIVLCIAAILIIVPIANSRKGLKEYIRIGDTSVSQLEFNYYKMNVLNTYFDLLPYFGVDTSLPYEFQMYDEETGMTWDDFFEQQAVVSLRENKALVADADAKGLTFDITAEYNDYLASSKASADEAGMSLKNYLLSMFGTSASEKNLEPIVKDDLLAFAYYEQLTGTMAPTDEEIQAEYDANPDNYDSVDYRVLDFPADITDESTEEEIAAALKEAEKKAQEMLDKVNAGEDFETLCATYAREDLRDDFADTETDRSLTTNVTKNISPSSYGEWLFEDHKDGETTLFTDEENYVCHVIKFEKRYKGESVPDTIKTTLTNTAVSDYINSLSKNYTIDDPNGYIAFPPVDEPNA